MQFADNFTPRADGKNRGIQISHDALKLVNGRKVVYSYPSNIPLQFEHRQGIANVGYDSDDICPCDTCGIPSHHGKAKFWLILKD